MLNYVIVPHHEHLVYRHFQVLIHTLHPGRIDRDLAVILSGQWLELDGMGCNAT